MILLYIYLEEINKILDIRRERKTVCHRTIIYCFLKRGISIYSWAQCSTIFHFVFINWFFFFPSSFGSLKHFFLSVNSKSFVIFNFNAQIRCGNWEKICKFLCCGFLFWMKGREGKGVFLIAKRAENWNKQVLPIWPNCSNY